MSASRTKYSSQRPGTRAPPAGSSKSGSRRSGERSRSEIPLSAATASTSSSSSDDNRPPASHVNFARRAPSVCPSDSISRVKPRTRPSSSGRSSERRTSKASRSAWQPSNSRASRPSTGRGTAWSGTASGSGAPLTEDNLERLNEKGVRSRSQLDAVAEEPRSFQQEGAPSSRRQYSRAVGTEQHTSARSSRWQTDARTTNGPFEGRASRRYGAVATQNAQQTTGTAWQSRSRKDSMSPEDTTATSKAGALAVTPLQRSAGSSSLQQSTSNAASNYDTSSGGWQRKVVVTTKRWPDGREVQEREISMMRTPLN